MTLLFENWQISFYNKREKGDKVLVKKSCFDVCGGDCEVCFGFGLKSLDLVPVLTKKKIHTKFVPPDMTALKMLVEKENDGVDLSSLTDEELKTLEEQLLLELER